MALCNRFMMESRYIAWSCHWAADAALVEQPQSIGELTIRPDLCSMHCLLALELSSWRRDVLVMNVSKIFKGVKRSGSMTRYQDSS
jgi:hypothetical protein